MKIQIISDLHLDVAPVKPIAIADNVDAVIVAGDTCEGAVRGFEQLRRIVPMAIPVVMVMGNHEYYRRFVPDELMLAREQAPSFNIHLLENDSAVIGRDASSSHGAATGGLRLVGATLWTDYAIFGAANVAGVMNACASGMNDHRLIGWQKQPWLRFRPQEALLLHHRSRAFLELPMDIPLAEHVSPSPEWQQRFGSRRLAETALQLLDAIPTNNKKIDRLPRFAILRWLNDRGHSAVLVFGPEGTSIDRGTEIPDLLDQYSDHCLFQVRIVRRQALTHIAKALR